MTATVTIDDAIFAKAAALLQTKDPAQVINRALELAVGARPLPEVEIYTDKRLAEFAEAEAELGEWFRQRDARER
jgi:hypothetical protein